MKRRIPGMSRCARSIASARLARSAAPRSALGRNSTTWTIMRATFLPPRPERRVGVFRKFPVPTTLEPLHRGLRMATLLLAEGRQQFGRVCRSERGGHGVHHDDPILETRHWQWPLDHLCAWSALQKLAYRARRAVMPNGALRHLSP